MLPLLLSMHAHAGDASAHELQLTSGPALAGEVVGSIVLGFMVPDLFFPNRPETRTCANASCGTNGFDLALSRAFLAPNPKLAAVVSHSFTLVVSPVGAITSGIVGAARQGRGVYAVQDAIIVIDAFLLSTGLNSLAKIGIARQRPAYHFGREDNTEAADHPGEEFLSFYSGDTTWAFAFASSASTLAWLRGYRHAPLATGILGGLALTGGLLRMSADMHWASDVLVGLVTGTAFGVGLPLALHRRKRGEHQVRLASTGNGLALSGRW
ncbi:MAG: phosphatase PAP2 family protein [Deltaproteobacteria bacterium]|nr:MAG: phosphatase PAP2 family protein [Deltaproteobacteria bacterium]